MSAYHLPRPMPSRLQFGSDTTLGFTDPMKYKTMTSSRKSEGDSLPSINSMFQHDRPPASSSSPLPPPTTFDSPRHLPSGHSSPRHDVLHEHHSYNARPRSDPALQSARYASSSREPPYDPHHSHSTIPSHQNPLYRRSDLDAHFHAGRPDSARAAYQTPMTTPLSNSYPGYLESNDYNAASPASLAPQHSLEFSKPSKPVKKPIREEHVPGEGMCYIYDDGSHVRKVIDGESVNAQWGVTKAGKPRKRLAVACLTCREKKIKCEPGEDKCTQCEKSGRECSYHQAPRGQQAGQRSPLGEHQARTPSSMSTGKESYFDSLQSPFADSQEQRPPSPKSPPRRSPSGELLISKRPRERSQRNSVDHSHSRRRLEYDLTPESMGPTRPPHQAERKDSYGTIRSQTSHPDLVFDLTNDPFCVNATAASHCMKLYFQHVNSATYRMFPDAHFLDWVQRPEIAKSPEELMVIYSMLAMGSLFSTRPEYKALGKTFGSIAGLANERSRGVFNLQTAQARLLLSLHHFATGESSTAWELCGSACRVIAALKLNLEEEVLELCKDGEFEYGLRGSDLAECYRRTYWSAFLMDRYNGYCAGYFGILNKEDSFVRLPSRERCETGSTTPYLDNGVIDRALCQPRHSSLDIMAYLVQISALWGEVLSFIYRSPQPSPINYAREYERFYTDISLRLQSWAASLPSEIIYSVDNIRLHMRNNDIRTFISIHTIFNISHIMLNRYVRHAHLSSGVVDRNVAAAIHHASNLIHVMREFLEVTRIRRTPSPTPRPSAAVLENHNFTFSTPFPGYAILVAIDVVTAAGSLEVSKYETLIYDINRAAMIVDEIANFWTSAKIQRSSVRRRITDMTNINLGSDGSRKKAWVMENPLDKTFAMEQDVMYIRDGGARIFRILGIDGGVQEGDVLRVEESSSREGSQGSAEEEGGPMGRKLGKWKGMKGYHT